MSHDRVYRDIVVAGAEEYELIRILSYHNVEVRNFFFTREIFISLCRVQVFVICYSIESSTSLLNIKNK